MLAHGTELGFALRSAALVAQEQREYEEYQPGSALDNSPWLFVGNNMINRGSVCLNAIMNAIADLPQIRGIW